MGLNQEQMRAMVRLNLSNQLPDAFPRPAFEPYLMPIIEPTSSSPGGGGGCGVARTCHAPVDQSGYVFARDSANRGRRRGGVRG